MVPPQTLLGHDGDLEPPASAPPRTLVPEQVRAAFDLGYAFDPVPQAHQLWRLEFEGTVSLAYVYAVDLDSRTARVFPVGEDPELADAATVAATPDETPLVLPLGIWVALERSVPLVVFDRPLRPAAGAADEGLAAVDTSGLDASAPDLRAAVEAVRRSLRSGEPLGIPPSRVGPPILSELDPRLEYRSLLAAELDRLADVAELRAVETCDTHEPSLARLLRDAELTPDDLMTPLGIGPAEARCLFRDTLPLRPGEVSAVADLAGVPVKQVRDAAPKPRASLRLKLHEPHRRRQIRRHADARKVSEVDARWAALRSVMAAAMRTSEQGRRDPDWDTLLDDFFATPEG
ncbi:MAG: hypothetical protein ACRDZO_05145 [Egibacteraceae bacterium]